MYENAPNRPIICVDIRSFYASCMASLHGLKVLEVPIAVVANFEQKGSVVLAASPPMKKRFGIKTGSRLYEIPKHPEIHLFEPKMEYFVRMSMEITRLFNEFVPKEAIHVYSVDESFIDLTGTEMLFKRTPEQIAKSMQLQIEHCFDLPCAIGMGPNMLMAKLALDIEAKKTGFARWEYGDLPEKLWPIRKLSEMWGIGRRTEKRLNMLGIYSVRDLAHADLAEMEKEFGVLGNQLYYHAWGVDHSLVGAPIMEGQISYGKGQMLMRDYRSREEILVVVLEMCEDVARRAREAFKIGRTITLGIGYSDRAFGGGFHHSLTIDEPTNETMKIYEACVRLFDTYYAERPARKISITLSNIESEYSMQLSLFDRSKWRRRKLGTTMDALRSRYGTTSVLRAVSYTEMGTARARNQLLGGHKK